MMKLRSLLFGCLLALMVPAWAQEVDVTTVLADTKTFIFDNNKNTVKGYIYAQLEENTTCCGEDRIYLEVKIDPSGFVVSAKPLTGKNDCMKRSAVDIVKNIKWNAADFKGPKSVYFEIKPNVECGEGLDNAYAELEIFNNPLLNPDGTRATTISGAPVAAEGTKPEADSSQIEQILIATGDRDPSAAPSTPEPEAESEEMTEERFVVEEATTPESPQPELDPSEPRLPGQLATAEGDPRGEVDPSLVSARDRAAAEEIARQREIDQLRQQLEQMRVEEEKRQERLRVQEERRKAREAQMQEQQSEFQDSMGEGGDFAAAEDDQSGGGLYFDDNGSGEDYGEEGDFMAGDSGDEDRLRQEIDELRQRQEDVRQQLMQREEEQMRIAEENRQANQEIIRLEEEIALKEEEVERAREDAELQAMEQEREQVAQERQAQDEEYQRMMDEIRRLQAEAEAQIRELEAKKAEIDRMEKLAKAREQEVALERALREQERQKRLIEIRAQLGRGGSVSTSTLTAGASDADLADLMSQIDLSAEADSEAIKLLVEQISQMRKEMAILQGQIRNLGGTPATTPITLSGTTQTTPPRAGTRGKSSKNNGTSNGVQSAATNTSWEDLDIFAPDVDPSEYGGAAGGNPRGGDQTTPAEMNSGAGSYDPVRGYESQTDDEHENLAGPRGSKREYIDGGNAMKQVIKSKLKQANICGLAQALYSVTLDPQGNVVRHSILGVNGPNKADIELQLMSIIPTLKFTQADIRINQTIYLEFKAEIVCEGQDQVDLQSVDPLLKNN